MDHRDEVVNTAQSQADKSLSDARAEAEKTVSSAGAEAEELLADARERAEQIVSEAQADPELFASTGSLSITMQNSPTLSGNNGTALRALDYSLNYTAPAVGTFNMASGDWDVAGNWSGGVPGTNKIVTINNNRTARVDQVVPTLDNMLIVGSGGSGGTLNVVAGGSLNLLGTGSFGSVYGGSIIVGRDSGSVGTYTQSGGTANAWRFAVGKCTSSRLTINLHPIYVHRAPPIANPFSANLLIPLARAPPRCGDAALRRDLCRACR